MLRSFGALVGDLLIALVFVSIGLVQHGTPLTMQNVSWVAWPFAVGVLLGHLAIRAWRAPFALWPQGVFVWAITIAAAMMLRTFPESGLRRHACIRRDVRRLHRRRIRLLRLRHHGILRCGRRLREARLRRRRHRPLRLQGLRLRSLPLLRRLGHLRRSTLRGPRLRPAGDSRRRRNLRPGLADSRAPRCSRPHAARGLHTGCGR